MSDFPDYEAAAKELHEQSADQSDTFDAAKAVVDAASGDGPLYREATASEWATGKLHSQDMPLVRVWPTGAPDADA